MTITEELNETELTERVDLAVEVPTVIEPSIDEGTPVAVTKIGTKLDAWVDTDSDFETPNVDADWELDAACRTVDGAADMFFSEELSDIVAAKAICAECPVIAPCLEGAIRRAEPCGVWGGQLFSNGRVLTQKRRRGRPPKVARPEDQLPVVPVPEHLQKLIA